MTVSTTGTDGVVPSLNCPADVEAGSDGTATWTPPTPTDASGIVSTTSTLTPGSVVPEGFTTVTYNTVDGTGNRASCSFIVQRAVTGAFGPVITSCPNNIQQTVTSASGIVTWTEPTAYDDSGHVRLVMQTHSPNTAFPVGTTPVEYLFQDPTGSTARCVFTVELTVAVGGVDVTPPVISGCPADITVNPDAGQTFATVTWTPPTATDNSGAQPNVASTHNPGRRFNANTVSQVTYTFWDARVNIATCQFTITVTGKH
ncbi:hyalin-like [Patiria miniata]|uniref:HYR domain-containing protein n=1 Tax=Patiria miniata TaxID=46514 RepID=A0A913Z6R9_PATMI|nr:hyalin-like [Patiria miniata]